MKEKNPFKLNPILFWPVVILMVIILALSFINQDAFSTVIGAVLDGEIVNLKWSVGPCTLLIFITMIVLMIHPIGGTKLGGPDATPDYSNFSYWGLCICSTIAIGIVFWGVAYPMTYYMTPYANWGVEAGSTQAAILAIAQTNIEWSYGQYGLYGCFAIAMGIAIYNYGQPMRTSSFLYLLRGKPASNAVNNIIDIICLFGIVAGVTCSLGTGTMQMTSGLNAICGLPISNMTWLLIDAVVVAGFCLMSIGGVAKGIKIVTDQNLRLYYIVMVLMLIIGPTVYILDMFSESTGYMFNHFVEMITYTGGITDDDMPIYWMIWLYVSAAAFAPIVGLFIAKVSRGRTIREMVIGNLVMPALVNSAWFTIFGATAIKWQQDGTFDIWGRMQELGTEAAMWEFFANLPAGKVWQVVFWVCIFLSFVTLASSSTTTAAITSMTPTREVAPDEEPNFVYKLIWGVIMGLSAYVFICFAGIQGAKSMALIGGLPSLLLDGLAAVILWKVMITFKKTGAGTKLADK